MAMVAMLRASRLHAVSIPSARARSGGESARQMLDAFLLIAALTTGSFQAGRAAPREEPPGTLLVTRYELEASARAGDPFLQVRARVTFRGASGRKTYPFRLRENFVVEEVRGGSGERLFFEHRSEVALRHLARPALRVGPGPRARRADQGRGCGG